MRKNDQSYFVLSADRKKETQFHFKQTKKI
jgi:hypothetical protein